MIQVQGKKYNKKEVKALMECFSRFEDFSDCINRICARCPYKNLCIDIKNAREYLSKILNEKQKE